jgi:excisionase family DNA binding protein
LTGQRGGVLRRGNFRKASGWSDAVAAIGRPGLHFHDLRHTGNTLGLLLTVGEAAERLRLGRTLVYRLISSGELESVTVGRLRRVPAECLAEYVASLRRTRDPGAAKGNSAA